MMRRGLCLIFFIMFGGLAMMLGGLFMMFGSGVMMRAGRMLVRHRGSSVWLGQQHNALPQNKHVSALYFSRSSQSQQNANHTVIKPSYSAPLMPSAGLRGL